MGLESLLASGDRPAKDAGIGDRSMNSKLWKKMRILLAKVLVVTFLINTTVYGGGTGSLAGLKLGRHDTATESNASRPAVDTASPSMPGFDADVDYGDFDDSGYDTDWGPAGTPSEAEPATPSNAVYRDGVIRIYNQRQLEAIGTGVPVTDSDRSYSDFGLGELMYLENELICYSQDAVYEVMRDIELPEYLWNIPEDFSGSFVSSQEQTSDVLYKRGSDTIYIYNPLQLAVLNQEDSDLEPVLTGDYSVSRFGTGNLIYPYPNASPSETNDYITYAKDHSYVLKAGFTTEYETATPSVALLDMEDISLDGRDYPGQTVAEIGGEKYILIGNKTQFDAIGTNVPVNGVLYRSVRRGRTGEWSDWELFYEGDTDFTNDAEFGKEHKNYRDYTIEGAQYFYYKYCPGKSDGQGHVIPVYDKDDLKFDEDSGAGLTGLTYSRDAKYIIFRDIDFEGADREPLYFTGTMLGAKDDKLKEVLGASDFDSIKDILKVAPQENMPVLNNISVVKTTVQGNKREDALKVDYHDEHDVGVGFFNLQSNDIEDKNLPKKTVRVSNLILNDVRVKNEATSLDDKSQGLLDALLLPLLKLIGLVENQKVNVDNDVLFSTGAFAGVIEGNVNVSNCHVKNLHKVSSMRGYTGGFVGSAKGIIVYETEGLEKVLDLINRITLGILGLGNLLNVLLNEGLLKLEELVPIQYINSVVDQCSVSYAHDAYVDGKTKKVGGFAGYI